MQQRHIYLHVGLSKSGTTYLQRTLWNSRDALGESGVLVPGRHADAQRDAAWDLLGRRLRGVHQPNLPGAWQRLVEGVTSWPGDKVVLSEEFLVHARPRHLRRIRRDFRGNRLHVVVTVRDLERTVVSMWQQELVMGHAWSFPEYVAAVRDPSAGPTTAGVRFWLRFDLARILAAWESIVPARRIHVVVVPSPGAPPELLAARFAKATGIDPSLLSLPDAPVNPSMGAVEAEMLRRLNARLGGQLNERAHNYLVEQLIRPRLGSSAPVAVPEEESAWIRSRAVEQANLLRESSYCVVGDPAELIPAQRGRDCREPDPVTEEAVAASAVTALHAVALDHARLRSQQARRATANPSVTTRLGSGARGLGFGIGFGCLKAADRNRLAARVALLYLRWLPRAR